MNFELMAHIEGGHLEKKIRRQSPTNLREATIASRGTRVNARIKERKLKTNRRNPKYFEILLRCGSKISKTLEGSSRMRKFGHKDDNSVPRGYFSLVGHEATLPSRFARLF